MSADARVSPTAHYTSYVFYRRGLSNDALASRTGALLYRAMRPVNRAFELMGHRTLETMLEARHRSIDRLIAAEIDSGRIGQVIEVACGMSPRGWRFSRRYPKLSYTESDLPGMVRTKRAALARVGTLNPRHRVVELDASADSGPNSIDAVASTLDPDRGTAIITEGLLPYFERPVVEAMWARFARALRRFPRGIYASDMHLSAEISSKATSGILSTLVVGLTGRRLRRDFRDEDDATSSLTRSGFEEAALLRPAELGLDIPGEAPHRRPIVRVIAARVG
jgi:O-methyltransferase involved in polyketide biosynthesis